MRASLVSPSSPATVTSRVGGRKLSEGAKSKVARRLAAVAAAHLSVLEENSADSSARTVVESTLRDRLIGSATGGGLLRRETPYLAVAAGDPEWIAAERDAIEHYAADDQRVRCFMSLADGVLALLGGDDSTPSGIGTISSPWPANTVSVSSGSTRWKVWRSARHEPARRMKLRGWPAPPSRRAKTGATATATRTSPSWRLDPTRAGRSRSRKRPRTHDVRAASGLGPSSGWAALTPTEAEVARTVADGLTNKQAAEQLFMSVPTVKTHLRHIFAKLRIDNRSQLVAEVAQHTR